MFSNPLRAIFACFSIAASALPFARGQTVVSDSFESGVFSYSWNSTAATTIQSPGGAAGSLRFAQIAANTTSRLASRFDAVQSGGSTNFTIEADLRLQSSATRQFQLQVSTSSAAVATNAAAINLRYQSGTWSAYDGTTWQVLSGLNAVTPGSWFRMRLTGRDWASSSARYDLEISSPGGTTYTSATSGIQVFHNSGSNSYSLPARYFVFTSEFETNPGFSVDNVLAVVGAPHASSPSPVHLAGITTTTQSGPGDAAAAIDNNPATLAETTNAPGSFWEMELNRSMPLTRIQLLAPAGASYANLLNGLILEVQDLRDQVVYSQTISGAVDGGLWTVDLPPAIRGRIIRIKLPPSGLNGGGDQRVAVAEARIFSPVYQTSGTNYALNTPSYMVRLQDALPPASYANDGNTTTIMQTTDKTVDAYWETDLGAERALHHVRVTGVEGSLEQYRLSRATLRLFDEDHNTVFSQRLSGSSPVFDVILPGPVAARYVRIGFENKIRSSPTNAIEWFLKIREVEAYGRPLDQTGIRSFSASSTQVSPGQAVQLSWWVDGLNELSLHPGIGSVGASTLADGSGVVTVTPSAPTRYMLVGKSGTATFVRYLTVNTGGQPLPPRISEFSASNRLALRDGFNEAPDWIEIHNPNASAMDISGYCLSDDPALPAKWAFPGGTIIPGHGHLVVCASGRSLASPDARGFLHAPFSLSATGETLRLSTVGGASLLDSVTFTAQDEDLSYGRTVDDGWTFMEPSPGQPNLNPSFAGWLLPPVFSETRGLRTAPFTLVLVNPNPDSQLYYSLDGSEPSTPYVAPLSITASRSVRATVRRSGYHTPRTVTHSFLFPSQVPSASGMNATYASGAYLTRQNQGFQDLPTVSLSVPELPDDYVETEGSAEFFLPGSPTPVQVNCGMERFGGAWTEFAKKSYKLNFSAEYGARKLEAPLFNGFDRGIPVKEVFDSLELRAGNHDMVARGFYMGGRFIEDTTLEMGSLNPHGRFVHVFVNGSYWGMYDMRERMVDAFLAEYLGGSKEDYVVVRGNDNVGTTTFIPGTPEPPNRELWESVRANRSSYMAVKDSLDVSHLIDFMLVWFYGNNENEYRCAGPIVPGSGFKFWLADSDGYLYSQNVASALTVNRTDNGGPGSIFSSLAAEGHPDFKTLLADRIQKHFFNNGALTPARNLARLNARMTEVQNAMVSECARWGYRTPENWASAADSIRTGLFPQRTANLLGYLRARGLFPAIDAPVLAQHGGSVTQGYPLTFSPITGTVYFTLDGSDPRLPGGGISSNALTWSSTSQQLVGSASTWKYWDLGSLPAANWHTAAYNDAAWASGTAPFGYGDPGIATTVSFGSNSNNKHPTTYFRKSFQVTNPSQFSQLTLGLVRDDGAVIYLNGVEIARSNMPAGTVGYSTTASTAVGGADETNTFTFSIPANALVLGSNVIAVELHQHGTAGSINSTDLRFDLSLTGSASGSAAIINSNTRVMARVFDGSTWSALTDATFRVAYPLTANGTYLLNSWSPSAAAGTYPPHMTFYQNASAIPDPPLASPMDNPWTLPYDRSTRSRVNGLGTDGFSFVNTSNPQAETGSGFMGSAVLALNTGGAQDIRVTWTGGTVVSNSADYAIRLQYRVGDSGDFTDVTNLGAPVEYLRNALAGHSQTIGPVTLPADANDKPLVQLRWKYHYRSGSGSRPQLRVDNIQVSAGNPAPVSVAVVSSPPAAQAGRTLPPVIVHARAANGALATGYNGVIQLYLQGSSTALGGSSSRPAINGIAVFDDLVIPEPGVFTFAASSTPLLSGEADNTTRVLGPVAEIVPAFIQGLGPVNDQRVPFAARIRINGLLPGATYRFANRMVTAADSPSSDGAGNMIFSRPAGSSFVRSLAEPAFTPADLDAGHGQFTSDASGSFSGWFLTEPTGNPRFAPGSTLYPLLLLNDGEGGSTVFHSLRIDAPVQAIAFGGSPGQGSAVHGEATAPPGSFVLLYDDPAGASRPLAATPVEATGFATDASYAAFYRSHVAGRNGRWGCILPNGLTSGARRIELRDRTTGGLLHFFQSDPHPLTSHLTRGANSVGIRVPAAGENGFALWQARNFDLDSILGSSLAAPSGQPASDGVPNLLKYAFGIAPGDVSRLRLPSTSIVSPLGQPLLRFQYRRLTAPDAPVYQILVSSNLSDWSSAESALLPAVDVTPDPGGLTETVTRHLPLQPSQTPRWLKLQVVQP